MLHAGTYTFSYLAHATKKGKFIAYPAKVEETHNPEFLGYSTHLVVHVADSEEKVGEAAVIAEDQEQKKQQNENISNKTTTTTTSPARRARKTGETGETGSEVKTALMKNTELSTTETVNQESVAVADTTS